MVLQDALPGGFGVRQRFKIESAQEIFASPNSPVGANHCDKFARGFNCRLPAFHPSRPDGHFQRFFLHLFQSCFRSSNCILFGAAFVVGYPSVFPRNLVFAALSIGRFAGRVYTTSKANFPIGYGSHCDKQTSNDDEEKTPVYCWRYWAGCRSDDSPVVAIFSLQLFSPTSLLVARIIQYLVCPLRKLY